MDTNISISEIPFIITPTDAKSPSENYEFFNLNEKENSNDDFIYYDISNYNLTQENQEIMNQDLLEEAGSDILELNTDLTLISDHQPVPTDYDTIKDLVNELIDRVDKQSQESRSVSRITIEKLKCDNPKRKEIPKNRSLTKSVTRPKPNILKRKSRKTISEIVDSKALYDTESSQVDIYSKSCDIQIENPFSQTNAHKADQPSTKKALANKPEPKVYKTRVKRKKTIQIVRETTSCYYREVLDSNNNVIRTEVLNEKKKRDIQSTYHKDHIISETKPSSSKSKSKHQSPNSSSSNNDIFISSSENETIMNSSHHQPSLSVSKLNTASSSKYRNSRKVLFSNRYNNNKQEDDIIQDTETPLSLRSRSIAKSKQPKAKHESKLYDKFYLKKQQVQQQEKTQAYSFSNLRFQLTPHERNKDLQQLQSQPNKSDLVVLDEEEPSLAHSESQIDDYLRNFSDFVEQTKILDTYESEAQANLLKSLTTEDPDPKRLTKKCQVVLKRLDEATLNYYKSARAPFSSTFKINDKVFSQKPGTKDGKFYPSVITSVQRLSTSPTYIYKCSYYDKNEYEKLTPETEPSCVLLDDEDSYLREDQIILYDSLQQSDSIQVYTKTHAKYSEFIFVDYSNESDKAADGKRVKKFIVKIKSGLRMRKLAKFQTIAISADEAARILSRKTESSSNLSEIEILNPNSSLSNKRSRSRSRSSITISPFDCGVRASSRKVRLSNDLSSKTHLSWTRNSNSRSSAASDDSLNLTVCRAIDPPISEFTTKGSKRQSGPVIFIGAKKSSKERKMK